MISNCLIEALKAKIKDPKNVTIHVFPAKVNGHGIFPHFWWSVGDQGFDFKKEGKSKQVILFKGTIRSYKKSTYIEKLTKLYRDALEKDFEKKGLLNPFDAYKWHYGKPTGQEAKVYYINYTDSEGKVCVRLVHAKDLDHYNIINWMSGNDEDTDELLINSEFINEDGLSIE